MRHAQLVTSRDAWLEDATRHAMVVGGEAIAVQWDLEATALIADAESAIIPSFGVATPDLAALVEDATASSTLDDLIARADTLQSRARDTNVVVAAYLPTVNTRAAEASTARAVTADLFDQVTERAAALAAIQAREQFAAQLAGMETGIQDANDNVAFNLASQMEGAGYQRQGSMWRRSSAIGSTLFGGTEYETHEVAAYRNFTSPGFRGQVDLSDEALTGLSGRAIFTLVDQAAEEMSRYQVLVFGRSQEQKDRNSDSFVQAASTEEFTDTLSQILSDAEAAWQRGAGYHKRENKDTEGLFNFHVGYAPVIDSDDPEKIGEAGYGQLGRIMGAFMVNEARAQRGYVALTTPAYRKPLWDDDQDNDGQSDGLFGAPTIASVVDIGVTVALTATGMGAPLVAALSMIDDVAFAAADIATGYQSAGAAFKQLGIKAATSAANTVTGGLFGGVGEGVTSTIGKAVINAGTSAARSAITNVMTTGINVAFTGNYTSFGDFLHVTGKELDSWDDWSSTAAAGVRGFAQTMLAGIDFGGYDDPEIADLNNVAGFGANALASGFEYATTGTTTVNIAPIKGVGTTSLTFDRNEGVSGELFSSAGNRLNFVGAMRGLETFAFNNAVRRYERTGNIDVLEGHTGTTDAGVALRSNYSFGDQAAVDQAWDIAKGDTLLRVGGELSDDGDANHMGLTTIENDRRVVHLATLGEEGDIASQLQAGTILQWEAHRDGRNNGFTGQWGETMNAAAGMANMAYALANSNEYGKQFSMSEQQVDIINAMINGGGEGLAMHVLENYDFTTGDNLLFNMTDGSIELDGDGWLKVLDAQGNPVYLRDAYGNRIGAQDTEEGLAIIAQMAGDIGANEVADLLAATGTENGTVIGTNSPGGDTGARIQNGLFDRLLDHDEDWERIQNATITEDPALVQQGADPEHALIDEFHDENSFRRVRMLANLNDEIWQDGEVGYANYLEDNLVRTTAGGRTFTTHRNNVNRLDGLSDHLTQDQINEVFSTFAGSFNPRTAADQAFGISTHALGLSVDIDPVGNPFYRLPVSENVATHERAIALFEAAASSHGGMGFRNYDGHIAAAEALQTAQRLGGTLQFIDEFESVQNALNQTDVLNSRTMEMVDFLQNHQGLYDHLVAIDTDSSNFGLVNDMINTGIVNHSSDVMNAFRNIGMPMLVWDSRQWGGRVGVDGMHFQPIDFGL